jgi:hypothetical protein
MSALDRFRKLWPVNTTDDPNRDLDGPLVGPCAECVPYGGGPLCDRHAVPARRAWASLNRHPSGEEDTPTITGTTRRDWGKGP